MDFGDLQSWIQAFSYPAVLALLLSAGFGAPVSEDLLLLAAGVVTATGDGMLPLMMAVAWVGVIVGDSILFRIGRTLGPRAANLPFLRRVLTADRVQWVGGHFARHGSLTVGVARFCMGLRAPTFVTAGMSGMSYRKFLLADGLAALVYAPLLVWLGWRFGEVVLADVEATMKWIPLAVVAAVVAVVAARVVRRRRAQQSPSGLRRAFTEGLGQRGA